MPIRWTPELDQLLLLKILETHEIKLDAKKVVEAWPSEKGEAPTPRAVTERLVRIRNYSKEAGKEPSKVSIANTVTTPSKTSTPKTPGKPRGRPANSNTSTPSKAKNNSAAATPKGKSPVKRQHDDIVKEEPLDLDGIVEISPLSKSNKPTFKMTTTGGNSLMDPLGEKQFGNPGVNQGMSRLSVHRDDEDGEQSPTKKPRLESTTPSAHGRGQENGAGEIGMDYYDDEEYVV